MVEHIHLSQQLVVLFSEVIPLTPCEASPKAGWALNLQVEEGVLIQQTYWCRKLNTGNHLDHLLAIRFPVV